VAAAGGHERHLMKVMKRLSSPLGHHSLDIPYTQKSRPIVGRICDKAPGLSENGSIYTHGHSFYMRGLVAMGLGDIALDELKKMMPDNTFPDITTGPPHQQSNYTVGKFHPHYGQNYFSNFTGSCPWYLKCFDHMFGVLADFDGVEIRPCAPTRWKEYRCRKIHLGIKYLVHFRNVSGKCRVSRVVANGEDVMPIDGRYKLFAKDYRKGATVEVVVEM
jgi:cellobionic acid phosphorylase